MIRKCNEDIVKQYTLNNLPKKYVSLYEYAKKICDLLKSKTPKISMEDDNGEFVVMENNNFEAKFFFL